MLYCLCLINSVLTGNFAWPRLTSGAFAFLESIAENPRVGKIRSCGLSGRPPFGYRSGQAFSKSVRSGAPQLVDVSLKDRQNDIRAQIGPTRP
jgi:hypothetical protein